ncbi:MAG TPA: lytic transglycosylase domain-containing protein [Vicinamibacterales bacterium]|nr:lytic transglycosylase domain-containing protein [Vicinamibacterales bacterium]
MRISTRASAVVVVLVLFAGPARAELVYFQNGRTMSIKSHRTDGDSLVLVLRGGGEIVCEPSTIARIAPDEVPYPEDIPPSPAPVAVAADTAVPYGEIIDKVSAAQGVDAKLVRALIRIESAYQQHARSRKGAMGLMQLMPETAKQYAVADPYEPESNIEAGIKHLKTLLERFAQNVPLALAAYNAGEATVRRFGGIPPYAETRDYVNSILALLSR